MKSVMEAAVEALSPKATYSLPPMLMFAIKDHKGGFFLRPFFMPSVPEALRQWQAIATNPQNMISNSPADYRFYLIGEFHPEHGEFKCSEKLVDLGCAADFGPQIGS